MALVLVSHPDCRKHEMGQGHPECPNRLVLIEQMLKKYFPPSDQIIYKEGRHAHRDEILLCHHPDHIELLTKRLPSPGSYAEIDSDTKLNAYTLQAAEAAVGSVIVAVDDVLENPNHRAFCYVRPPGHHAERHRAMGFCFYNNVAIGAYYALEKKGLKRVAIVDFDVHHGNGTEDLVCDDKRILFLSSFQDPFYPHMPYSSIHPRIVNIPLEAGMESDHFRELTGRVWFDALRKFSPEMIFFSAGFDGHVFDLLGQIDLREDDFFWITQNVVQIAQEVCQGRVVSVLEGGYHMTALASSVKAHLNGLL